MKENKTERFTLRATKEDIQALEQLAEYYQLSQSAVLRFLVAKAIEELPQNNSQARQDAPGRAEAGR